LKRIFGVLSNRIVRQKLPIKARSFLVRKNIYCIIRNGLAFIVSEVQFESFALEKPASGKSHPWLKLAPSYVHRYILRRHKVSS
jgi:hypothetical protein